MSKQPERAANLAIIRLGCVADSTERYQQATEIQKSCLQNHQVIGEKQIAQAMRLYWNTAYDQSLVSRDGLYKDADRYLKVLREQFDYQILLLSRRPESHLRQVTEQWLQRQLIGPHRLVLCPDAFLPEDAPHVLSAQQEATLFAGLAEAFARFVQAGDMLYVDFNEENRSAVESALGGWRVQLRCSQKKNRRSDERTPATL